MQLVGLSLFDVQIPIFGIDRLAFDAQRLEAAIGFKNKSLKPTKLANVQLIGSPIFNIQCPIFGIE